MGAARRLQRRAQRRCCAPPAPRSRQSSDSVGRACCSAAEAVRHLATTAGSTGCAIAAAASRACRQGAAADIAPLEFPAAADPYVTIALMNAAKAHQIPAHMGVTASVDTFYEGQERHASANPHLLRRHIGATAEYQNLRIVNYEMEAGTLFKMGLVYGFAAGCVCAAVAQRTSAETIVLDQKAEGVDRAIRTAVAALELLAS